MKTIKISIGGINFRFSSSEYPIFSLDSLFKQFKTITPASHIKIRFSPLSHAEKIYPAKLIGQNPGNWEIYKGENTYIIRGYDSITKKKNRILFIDGDFQKGNYYSPPEKNIFNSKKGWFIPRFFSPFGELIIINHLSFRKGVLFHGAALKVDNKVWVFTGPPEAGKSTMMNLWKTSNKGIPLNDETIIIREDRKDVIKVFGTPWGGTAEVQSSENGSLGGIFFLYHHTHPSISILSPAEALSRLIPQTFLPFWEKEKLEKVLSFLEEMSKKTKAFNLGFAKNRNIIEFLLKFFQECV